MSDIPAGPSSQSFSESSDSEGDENICRSPTKSPQKFGSVLKRKRLSLEDSSDDQPEDSVTPEVSEPTDSDFQFKEPTFRKKKFTFFTCESTGEEDDEDSVSVIIPEQLAASYGLYVWPSSPVLAWYLWLDRQSQGPSTRKDDRVLELGAGTALPGILLAKLGHSVILSDNLASPQSLHNCREAVKLNDLQEKVEVVGLTWGLVTSSLLKLRNGVDLIIGSDLFFDPAVFEPLLVTIKWLLDNNQGARFICTVQERSADWSIELLLKKYSLLCSYEYPQQFLRGSGIEERDLVGSHNIFILKIFKK